MGIYISDIKIPGLPKGLKYGDTIPYVDVRIFADGSAVVLCETTPYSIDSVKELSITEIPTPHGRLIDADELMKHELQATLFPEGREKNIDIWTHAVAIGDVIGAATIIEAEEPKE